MSGEDAAPVTVRSSPRHHSVLAAVSRTSPPAARICSQLILLVCPDVLRPLAPCRKIYGQACTSRFGCFGRTCTSRHAEAWPSPQWRRCTCIIVRRMPQQEAKMPRRLPDTEYGGSPSCDDPHWDRKRVTRGRCIVRCSQRVGRSHF